MNNELHSFGNHPKPNLSLCPLHCHHKSCLHCHHKPNLSLCPLHCHHKSCLPPQAFSQRHLRSLFQTFIPEPFPHPAYTAITSRLCLSALCTTSTSLLCLSVLSHSPSIHPILSSKLSIHFQLHHTAKFHFNHPRFPGDLLPRRLSRPNAVCTYTQVFPGKYNSRSSMLD